MISEYELINTRSTEGWVELSQTILTFVPTYADEVWGETILSDREPPLHDTNSIHVFVAALVLWFVESCSML